MSKINVIVFSVFKSYIILSDVMKMSIQLKMWLKITIWEWCKRVENWVVVFENTQQNLRWKCKKWDHLKVTNNLLTKPK